MSGWTDEEITQLRGASLRADDSLPALVHGRLDGAPLQMVGDGLLGVLARGATQTAVDVALECAAALRHRDWEGDAELADQLAAAGTEGPTPMLRVLAVDLDMVSLALHADPMMGESRIDVRTGQWRVADLGDDLDDDDLDDDERWLYLEPVGSRDSYRDMEVFISTVDDPGIADRLEIAITGRGAFRRFKDVLSRWPDERSRYFVMRDERELGRARAWLAARGYRPAWARSTNP